MEASHLPFAPDPAMVEAWEELEGIRRRGTRLGAGALEIGKATTGGGRRCKAMTVVVPLFYKPQKSQWFPFFTPRPSPLPNTLATLYASEGIKIIDDIP